MRTASCVGALIAAAGLFAALAPAQDAGGSPHEIAVKEMLAALDKLGTIVTTITDEASAATAKGELAQAVKQAVEVRARAEALPQPSKEEKDRLAALYQRKFIQAVNRLEVEKVRAQIIPGGKEAVAALKALDPPKPK